MKVYNSSTRYSTLHTGHKTFLLLLSIMLTLISCDKCEITSGNTPLVSYFLGKWKLVQISYPKSIQSNFAYEEVLSIEATSGKPWELEKIFRNRVQMEVREWGSYSEICKENSVLVMFPNGLQRKYWLTHTTSDPFRMEATGYVKQIGGTDDTLRYYYDRTQQ